MITWVHNDRPKMPVVRINELRLSGRFLVLEQAVADPSAPKPVYLYQRLAAERINVAFLHLDFLASPRQITCLVAPETFTCLGEVPGGNRGAQEPDLPSGAGLISAFPHHCKPALIGAIFCALDEAGCCWHCMATSGSLLAIVADFSSQKQIAEAICRYVDLPEDKAWHCAGQAYDAIARSLKTAPETVAQYVETRIKTYGIQVKTGLTICTGYVGPAALGSWGRAMAGSGFHFAYAAAAVTAQNGIKIDLVLDLKAQHTDVPATSALCRLENRRNGEMISFHGPHFGDRYGIADKALGCLGRSGVPVWMAGCVGATVSLVVPPDMGAKGAEALSDIFYTPLRDR